MHTLFLELLRDSMQVRRRGPPEPVKLNYDQRVTLPHETEHLAATLEMTSSMAETVTTS
jgi:hypothetical protein